MPSRNSMILVICFYTLMMTCLSKKIVCGNPPKCYFYTTIMLMECRNVREIPTLENEVSLRTRTILISGKELDHWPVALYNRSLFPELQSVRLEKTALPCHDISKEKLWYHVTGCISEDQNSQIKIISKFTNVTLGSPRPVPKLKTVKPGMQQTTAYNDTAQWTTLPLGPVLRKKTISLDPLRPNIRTVNQEPILWFNPTTTEINNGTTTTSARGDHQGFVREELLRQARIFAACHGTIMLAVIVILLIVMFRYRRQHGKHISKKVFEGRSLPSVENLGVMSLDNASGESIEQFSRDISRPASLRRRSMEKDL